MLQHLSDVQPVAVAFSFAAGVEYLEYEGEYQPDSLTVAGEYNGVPILILMVMWLLLLALVMVLR